MNARPQIASPDFRRDRSHWLLVMAALLLGLCLAGNASAGAYLPAIGGPGGGQFKAPCNAGELLTGFELRAGDDIDAIRPVCVTATGPREISAPPLTTDSGLVGPPNSTFNPQQLAPGWYGGTGGSIQRLLCPDDMPIVIGVDVGAEGIKTITVNNIHLFCGLAVADQTPSDQPSNVFDAPKATPSAGPLGLSVNYPQSTTGSERCPADQVAVGMHGRAGVWLDAMGLICDAPHLPPLPPKPPVALGRVQGTPAPPPQRMGDEPPICAQARSARARNSPVASSLQKECQAAGGNFEDRSVAQAPTEIRARNALAILHAAVLAPPAMPPVAAEIPPVQRPHDLIVGHLSFFQDGEPVQQIQAGKPVAITCSYAVRETPNPFVHLRSWQGSIEIGGAAPQTLEFQGRPNGGQYQATVTWLPTDIGEVPVSCILNPKFADAEAYPNNNRWNQTVMVLSAQPDQ